MAPSLRDWLSSLRAVSFLPEFRAQGFATVSCIGRLDSRSIFLLIRVSLAALAGLAGLAALAALAALTALAAANPTF